LLNVELPADPHEGLALLLYHPSNLCRSDNTSIANKQTHNRIYLHSQWHAGRQDK